MDCPEVRDLLPEQVLGALDPERDRWVRRHLAWCAGCRKEAGELAEGAAIAGLALPAEDPPAGLEERVVGAVARAARPRRPRGSVVAAVVAATLAVAASGVAVTMAGRAQQLERAAQSAEERAQRFAEVQRALAGPGEGRVLSARLVATSGSGGGRAILFDAAGAGDDWVVVIAGELSARGGPYAAYVRSGASSRVIGRLSPANPGELSALRFLVGAGYDSVVVTDHRDRIILLGPLVRYRD